MDSHIQCIYMYIYNYTILANPNYTWCYARPKPAVKLDRTSRRSCNTCMWWYAKGVYPKVYTMYVVLRTTKASS
jgi:hypothetical protein